MSSHISPTPVTKQVLGSAGTSPESTLPKQVEERSVTKAGAVFFNSLNGQPAQSHTSSPGVYVIAGTPKTPAGSSPHVPDEHQNKASFSALFNDPLLAEKNELADEEFELEDLQEQLEALADKRALLPESMKKDYETHRSKQKSIQASYFSEPTPPPITTSYETLSEMYYRAIHKNIVKTGTMLRPTRGLPSLSQRIDTVFDKNDNKDKRK
ncbi:MAG TPA: hypothetical protein VGJ00_05725 [Rhabdochlamydiaceae bacterium]|jgi:hypothetical protein